MKTTAIFFALCLMLASLSYGQAQTDSLTLGDTISLKRTPVIFSTARTYRYHLASNLSSFHLAPFLKKSSDPEVKRLVERYRTLAALQKGGMWLGFVGYTGSIFVAQKNPSLARVGLLGSAAVVYGSIFLPIERSMERAVNQHNQSLRGRFSDYYQPVVGLISQSERLTMADTITWKGASKFFYRGVRVDPARNLPLAFDYLNNGRLNGNMRYVRTARRVSGFATGLASGLLTGYFLGYILRRNASVNRNYPLNRPFVYSMAGVIGAGIAFNWHLNRVQAGTVEEYNQRLKERLANQE
jgi:hypothetical protein